MFLFCLHDRNFASANSVIINGLFARAHGNAQMPTDSTKVRLYKNVLLFNVNICDMLLTFL